jgi:hypothetical protein
MLVPCGPNEVDGCMDASAGASSDSPSPTNNSELFGKRNRDRYPC